MSVRLRCGTHTLVLLALATMAAFVVLACSDDDDPSAAFEPRTDGVLTVATDLPSPGFWDGETVASLDGGFEYRIAQELAKRFDLRLEVIEVPFERLVAGDLGDADIALAQITSTDERARVLDFSEPYFDVTMGVLVPAGKRVADLAAAKGLRWVVEAATTQVTFLEQTVRPSSAPLVVPDRNGVVAALEGGRADAALLDLPSALASANESKGALEVTAQFRADQQLAVALPQDSDNVEAVNSAIREWRSSGDLDAWEESELHAVLGQNPDDVPVIAPAP